ncbi:transmembrane channel-like protein 3 isoform X2 [Papilio machaon]|uniref:transmembrane channel-like protein 3 isoform X2 n=1 Tax=Papilio machaon TaxID=76193 RepID=UPI001E665987|nr:transmembrane channel-like protein 3 isoform X2 [Papilio machaon]
MNPVECDDVVTCRFSSTLRLRRSNSDSEALLTGGADSDRQADIIVREMEQLQRLMEDNPVSEELRREALRDLPQGLTMKRTVRAKLSASVSLRSKHRPISFYKRLKYRISFALKKGRDRISELIFSIEPWHEAIRHLEGQFGSAVGSYFHFLRWLFALNLLLAILLLCFVVVPQVLHDQGNNRTGSMGFLDFVSGKGGFEDSVLFYGHYHWGDVNSFGPLTYNMPFSYFFTMISLYLFFFAILCYRTAYSYRRNFIEIAGGLSNVFASKVFCGWDFGIVSQHAAALNASSIYNEFKELLSEQNKKHVTMSLWRRVWQYMVNVVVTGAVLALVAGLQYGLWLLLALKTEVQHWEIFVSLIITFVVALCPLLFNLIVRVEYYKARTALYVTLARTGLLDISTLTMLLVYWTQSDTPCWESALGRETYRLVLLDALVSLFLLPLVEFARGFIFKLNPNSGAPEFNIAYNSLTLVYNQAVLWLGAVWCPLLAVAVALKFLLLFYVKRECALRACQPARKVWRAAQTQTVLYMLVTLSLFVTLFSVGSLFLRGSSQTCGPFVTYTRVWGVVSEGVLRLPERPALRRVLSFLTRPGVIAFLFLSLCVATYFMRARARAQRSMVDILRRMLVLQAKDKDFLLAAIDKVSNGEWLYNPREEEQAADSHTLKYLQEVRKPSNAAYHFDVTRLNHSMSETRPHRAETRPHSYHVDRRRRSEDGDTDSSFSWQGSASCLNHTKDQQE